MCGRASDRFSDVIKAGRAIVALGLTVAGLAACSDTSPDVTVTNRTDRTIRLSGNCVADNDAYTLAPGETSNDFYPGSQCRIDDGDGLKGMLGCVTLKSSHTNVTVADLRDPPGPDQCWGSGPSP
jgi:hypothetical protein